MVAVVVVATAVGVVVVVVVVVGGLLPWRPSSEHDPAGHRPTAPCDRAGPARMAPRLDQENERAAGRPPEALVRENCWGCGGRGGRGGEAGKPRHGRPTLLPSASVERLEPPAAYLQLIMSSLMV